METWFANSLVRLRAELIADHMVDMVALDELFAGVDRVVAQINDATTPVPPVPPITAATGTAGQVAAPQAAGTPYAETQVNLALAHPAGSTAAEASVEDPADWSAGEDDDEHSMLDDAVEQDRQRQILEGRAVRTTGETLEQLASAGVHPEWDDVYGHAEWLITCGGLYAQDDDFVVARLLDAHSRLP